MASKFDTMGFCYDGCYDAMFVANANKHTAEETVEMCKKEYEYKFDEQGPRVPTIEDVESQYCAHRLGMDEWPDGCYTIVEKGARGSFPVFVIYFDKLSR